MNLKTTTMSLMESIEKDPIIAFYLKMSKSTEVQGRLPLYSETILRLAFKQILNKFRVLETWEIHLYCKLLQLYYFERYDNIEDMQMIFPQHSAASIAECIDSSNGILNDWHTFTKQNLHIVAYKEAYLEILSEWCLRYICVFRQVDQDALAWKTCELQSFLKSDIKFQKTWLRTLQNIIKTKDVWNRSDWGEQITEEHLKISNIYRDIKNRLHPWVVENCTRRRDLPPQKTPFLVAPDYFNSPSPSEEMPAKRNLNGTKRNHKTMETNDDDCQANGNEASGFDQLRFNQHEEEEEEEAEQQQQEQQQQQQQHDEEVGMEKYNDKDQFIPLNKKKKRRIDKNCNLPIRGDPGTEYWNEYNVPSEDHPMDGESAEPEEDSNGYEAAATAPSSPIVPNSQIGKRDRQVAGKPASRAAGPSASSSPCRSDSVAMDYDTESETPQWDDESSNESDAEPDPHCSNYTGLEEHEHTNSDVQDSVSFASELEPDDEQPEQRESETDADVEYEYEDAADDETLVEAEDAEQTLIKAVTEADSDVEDEKVEVLKIILESPKYCADEECAIDGEMRNGDGKYKLSPQRPPLHIEFDIQIQACSDTDEQPLASSSVAGEAVDEQSNGDNDHDDDDDDDDDYSIGSDDPMDDYSLGSADDDDDDDDNTDTDIKEALDNSMDIRLYEEYLIDDDDDNDDDHCDDAESLTKEEEQMIDMTPVDSPGQESSVPDSSFADNLIECLRSPAYSEPERQPTDETSSMHDDSSSNPTPSEQAYLEESMFERLPLSPTEEPPDEELRLEDLSFEEPRLNDPPFEEYPQEESPEPESLIEELPAQQELPFEGWLKQELPVPGQLPQSDAFVFDDVVAEEEFMEDGPVEVVVENEIVTYEDIVDRVVREVAVNVDYSDMIEEFTADDQDDEDDYDEPPADGVHHTEHRYADHYDHQYVPLQQYPKRQPPAFQPISAHILNMDFDQAELEPMGSGLEVELDLLQVRINEATQLIDAQANAERRADDSPPTEKPLPADEHVDTDSSDSAQQVEVHFVNGAEGTSPAAFKELDHDSHDSGGVQQMQVRLAAEGHAQAGPCGAVALKQGDNSNDSGGLEVHVYGKSAGCTPNPTNGDPTEQPATTTDAPAAAAAAAPPAPATTTTTTTFNTVVGGVKDLADDPLLFWTTAANDDAVKVMPNEENHRLCKPFAPADENSSTADLNKPSPVPSDCFGGTDGRTDRAIQTDDERLLADGTKANVWSTALNRPVAATETTTTTAATSTSLIQYGGMMPAKPVETAAAASLPPYFPALDAPCSAVPQHTVTSPTGAVAPAALHHQQPQPGDLMPTVRFGQVAPGDLTAVSSLSPIDLDEVAVPKIFIISDNKAETYLFHLKSYAIKNGYYEAIKHLDQIDQIFHGTY